MTYVPLEDARLFPFRRTGLIGSLSLGLTLLVMGVMMMGASKGCAEAKPPETLAPTPQSISVYALSRGKGVPDQAREVLAHSRTLLKSAQERGEVRRMVEQRIGIEGETRLCAEFSDVESVHSMIEQIQQLGQGVDLINVKVEPCSPWPNSITHESVLRNTPSIGFHGSRVDQQGGSALLSKELNYEKLSILSESGIDGGRNGHRLCCLFPNPHNSTTSC